MFWFLSIVYAVCSFFLTYCLERIDTQFVLASFALLFLLYFAVFSLKAGVKDILVSAIIIRSILIFAEPNLSDDIYRYIWDGRSSVQMINPFLYLPSDLFQSNPDSDILTSELLEKMNSPEYYSVYPAFSQILFAVSSVFAPTSFISNVVVLKFLYLLFEIGTMFLILSFLKLRKMPEHLLSLYALSPLVIIEVMGNAHLEGVMVFFLIAALYYLEKKNYSWSSVFLALAVSTKMLPLILMPAILLFIPRRKFLIYTGTFTLTSVTLFLPFFNIEIVHNIFQSIDLYFQKFEFNASIYYLVREIGFLIAGYNIISIAGKLLAIISTMMIVFLAFMQRSKNIYALISVSYFSFLIYFAFATTIHPWYLTTLVGLSVFLPYRTAIVWSGTVTVSYVTYNTFPYQESLALVIAEYFIVIAYMIYELWYKKTPQEIHPAE